MQAFLEMVTRFFEIFESGNEVSFTEILPEITDPYMVILIAALLIIAGILQCFLGFKFFKVWCSFIGLLLGSIIGIGVSMMLVPPGEAYSEYIRVFFIICIALLCAFAAYRAYQVGLFLYAFGIVFALCYLPLSMSFEQIMIAIIAGMCAGIAAGVVAVIIQRMSIIIATCLSGGLAIATGIIFLLGNDPNPVVVVLVPSLAAMACAVPGFFVQMATTKKKTDTKAIETTAATAAAAAAAAVAAVNPAAAVAAVNPAAAVTAVPVAPEIPPVQAAPPAPVAPPTPEPAPAPPAPVVPPTPEPAPEPPAPVVPPTPEPAPAPEAPANAPADVPVTPEPDRGTGPVA